MTDGTGGLTGRLGKLATSTLANALDDVGLHGNVMGALLPVTPGARMVGPAVTVKELSGPYGSFESEDFKVGAIIDAAGPGDVVVIDCAGAACSTWGGTASLAAQLKGVAGLVVDGAVRDREEIDELGFPVFSRHVVPTTGRHRLKVEAINVPVEVGGVGIEPGDLVLADGTGLVALPRRKAAEIIERAEAMADDDASAIEDLRGRPVVLGSHGKVQEDLIVDPP